MEDCREVQRMPWLANMGRDGAFAWRLLKRSPGFAAAAIVTLALGLGANTAIYSVIRGVLLRPAPLPSLDRLVMIWETARTSSTTGADASPIFPPGGIFNRRAFRGTDPDADSGPEPGCAQGGTTCADAGERLPAADLLTEFDGCVGACWYQIAGIDSSTSGVGHPHARRAAATSSVCGAR
jgi:hypothetical protein